MSSPRGELHEQQVRIGTGLNSGVENHVFAQGPPRGQSGAAPGLDVLVRKGLVKVKIKNDIPLNELHCCSCFLWVLYVAYEVCCEEHAECLQWTGNMTVDQLSINGKHEIIRNNAGWTCEQKTNKEIVSENDSSPCDMDGNI